MDYEFCRQRAMLALANAPLITTRYRLCCLSFAKKFQSMKAPAKMFNELHMSSAPQDKNLLMYYDMLTK